MKRLVAVAVFIVACCLVFMQWEQLATLKVVAHSLRRTEMTDPGALELKAAWRIGADGEGKPIIHTVSVVRNAPTETVSAWESRFVEAIQADLVTYPPIN